MARPDPMLGLTIANKSMLQNLSNEELLNEMGKMNFNCTLIKNEMTALERFAATWCGCSRRAPCSRCSATQRGGPATRHQGQPQEEVPLHDLLP